MSPVVATAPAKINLHLGVGDLRDDGYHDLVTVFCALSMGERVTVTTRRDSAETRMTCRGDDADDVPRDSTNLAWRAVEAVFSAAPERIRRSLPGGFDIHIDKSVPVAGGMAGGSADAAAALVATDHLLGTGLSKTQLRDLGGTLGADVPFALLGGIAVGTGTGTDLAPVLHRIELHVVVALASEGLSTPRVFAELDRLREKAAPTRVGDPTELLQALAGGDVPGVARYMGNDLQAAAITLQPNLRRTLRAGEEAGALRGIVSGSGPTCVFVCESAESAAEVAAELAGSGTCRSVRVASGPVAGARLEQ